MPANYLETIFALLQNDSNNTYILSKNLKSFYDDITPAEREIIDNIVISICGYSLDSIIIQADKIIMEAN